MLTARYVVKGTVITPAEDQPHTFEVIPNDDGVLEDVLDRFAGNAGVTTDSGMFVRVRAIDGKDVSEHGFIVEISDDGGLPMTLATTTSGLGDAIAAGALRSVNFFNGRLLTGEDLVAEQSYRARRCSGSGRDGGYGVALRARGPRALRDRFIGAADGDDRRGAGDQLPRSGPRARVLHRRRARPEAATANEGWRSLCGLRPAGRRGTYQTGAGVYLLTIAARRRPIGPERGSAGCGTKP